MTMRPASALPPQRGGRLASRGRFLLFAAAAVLFFIILSLRGIAGFYTDYLWFDSLGRATVWWGILRAQLALFAIFTGSFFLLLLGNFVIADRIAPLSPPMGPEEELLDRYRDFVGGRERLVRFVVAGLFALIAGSGASDQWNEWLLFTNGDDFGVNDPQFNTDLAFFIFRLPFLTYVVNWLFAAFVFILFLTIVAHYVNGGIRLNALGQRATPQVKAHMSVLLAILAAVKAVDYWLQRYELTVSTRGVVHGATYTDVNAQLPAIKLLILISIFAVALLLANIWWRGWALPTLAVGLWAFVAIIMGGIYPAVVQRFQVDPNESTREAVFTTRNILATRDAVGIDAVDRQPFAYNEGFQDIVDDQVLAENADVLNDVRLIDPRIVGDTFQNLEGERGIYQFPDTLDTDRYLIDGELTPVVVGARELDLTEQDQWELEHIRFTHGYGLAMAQADTTRNGRPDFLVGSLPLDIDSSVDIEVDQPQLYYSEGLGGYAIVGTTRDEIDYTDSNDNEVPFRYDGEGGVNISSFIRQLAFSMRFGQIDPLISNSITPESRVLFNRDVTDRAKNLAPFLAFDSNPYPVVVDGRLVYVIDAYTTTDRYPYGQTANTSNVTGGSGLRTRSNYIRNSIKAVVDSYSGDVQFYRTPGVDDPIIDAYSSAFPGLFRSFDEMPDTLRDHLRYPLDLYTVQTNMWGRYRLNSDDPAAFISASAAWTVAQDPGRSPDSGAATDPLTAANRGPVARVDPYYAVLRLPGEAVESFVAVRSFVPLAQPGRAERRELTAILVADSSAENYGRLVEYRMESNNVGGPGIVASNILSDPDVSRLNTQLNDNGSEVKYGDFQLIPMGESVLFVRPLYVQADGDNAVPELRRVVVSMGGEVAMGETFGEALDELFGTNTATRYVEPQGRFRGSSVPIIPDEDGDEPDPDQSDVLRLLIELLEIESDRADASAERADRIREQIAELYKAEGEEVPDEFLPPATTIPAPPEDSSTTTTTEPEPA